MPIEKIDKHPIPRYFINGPHMIHRNGWFCLPGEDNDYVIAQVLEDPHTPYIFWMVPLEHDEAVAIFRSDTGEKWGWTPGAGEYVNTRKE